MKSLKIFMIGLVLSASIFARPAEWVKFKRKDGSFVEFLKQDVEIALQIEMAKYGEKPIPVIFETKPAKAIPLPNAPIYDASSMTAEEIQFLQDVQKHDASMRYQ